MNSRLNHVEYLLAGDVGATKTTFGLFDLKTSRRNPIKNGTFINKRFKSFEEIFSKFTSQIDHKFSSVCLGVAGPVIGGRVSFTNIEWEIGQKELREAFSLKNVWLINDLQASAEGIELLNESELKAIWKVDSPASGNQAVIAPGTGLGEAFLIQSENGYTAHPSEGGHSDFAPRNNQQWQLFNFMKKRVGNVSVENVCSGTAIPDLFEFIKTSQSLDQPEFLNEFNKTEMFSEKIFQFAMDSPTKCKICDETLNLFLEILGAEMSNFALKIGTSGGIYLGGGIAPKIAEAFERGLFLEAYFDKGRYRKYLEGIPIWLIINDQSPLMGAANYAYKQLLENNQEN